MQMPRKKMKKLGDRNWMLIKRVVKTYGTWNPEEVLPLIVEELYTDEFLDVARFLTWVHETGRTMGDGNYEQVFSKWIGEMERTEV